MNILNERIKNHLINNLSEAWIEEAYFWQGDFIYEYFTNWFISRAECYSSINNEASTLNAILLYLQIKYISIEETMNAYVRQFAIHLCEHDAYVHYCIQEIIRIKRVKHVFPLIMNRYLPVDVIPLVYSFLTF